MCESFKHSTLCNTVNLMSDKLGSANDLTNLWFSNKKLSAEREEKKERKEDR